MKGAPERLWPIAWGLGAACGLALALSLGAYGPSWGEALAFPAVALVLAFGAWKERADEGQELTHLLRLGLGLTAAFLLVSLPLTLWRVAELEDTDALRAALAAARTQLALRWLVIALALPIGAATLWGRRRGDKPGPPPCGR